MLPDLDGGLDRDPGAVRRGVARLDAAHVGPGGREVARRIDPAQVPVRLVRARHQAGEALQRLVGHHLHAGADRPDEARHRPERLPDLLGLRGSDGGASERILELDVVQAVVAADHHQQRAAVGHEHGEGLDQRPGGHTEHGRHLVDRRRAGGLHDLGRVQRLGQPVDRLRAWRWPPPRWRRSPPRRGPRRSRRPGRAPCTRARRSRPSPPRPTPPGTTRALSGRRCGRRRSRTARRSARAPRGRGRRSRRPS